MTPKERVHAALRREPVDRVPVFMWFHPQTARLLEDAILDMAADQGLAAGIRKSL
jgi:uroporphyrinogen-III decarboxylase